MNTNDDWPEDNATYWVVNALHAASHVHSSPAFRKCSKEILRYLAKREATLDDVPRSWPALDVCMEAMDALTSLLHKIPSETWRTQITQSKNAVIALSRNDLSYKENDVSETTV